MQQLKIKPEAIELIKQHEGLRLQAYRCPAGKPTIGYGSTFYQDGRPVRMGDTITEAAAEELLLAVIGKVSEQVKKELRAPVTDCMFSALVSLTYNIGIGQFSGSTLLRKLNGWDYRGASEEFSRWVYAKGVRLNGLVKRREEEYNLFITDEK